MKTEIEVRDMLADTRKQHMRTLKRFKEYDNHEDMELLAIEREWIALLEWVIGASVRLKA